MIINFEKIKELLKNENLKEVSRQTGIPYRTLQNWKLGSNTWLKDVEDRLYKLNDYIKKKEEIEMIKKLTAEEFYNLDEVSVESDGFYFTDEESDISEMAPTPEEALLPEDEWNGEDYTNHLHPAYLPAWKKLQDKVVEAYENI